MGHLKADLESTGLTLIETHISWVFVGERDVYKVKRPVDFGFLDFTTPDQRREACEAELRLNRRLAPDVYLRVVPITVDDGGTHVLDGTGRVVDWAVHMRRLDDSRRADNLLATGALDRERIDALAERVAAFHSNARCDPSYGDVDTIRGNVEENFEQTRQSLGHFMSEAEAAEIEAWQLGELRDETKFVARAEAERIREGHGDLRLEHVYFEPDGSITIVDCIEFNDRFRYGDVCSDIAFLSMDLAWHGRIDLAERFLATYARVANDFALYRVVDFYESYRAFVRGKIACFLADDEEASHATRARAKEEARRYFMLSLAYERPPLVPPRIIAVAGPIASGKSKTAHAAGELLSAPVVSSDRTRKHLAGRQANASLKSEAWSGAYSEEATASVYDALLIAAEAIVSSGRPVVLDASFRSRSSREKARELARALGVPFLMVECAAPRDELERRLEKRASRETHESDARAELLDDFLARFEPIDELPEDEHLLVDTTQPRDENRARLAERLAP